MPSGGSSWTKTSDSGKKNEPRTKTSQSDEDNSRSRGDRYTNTGDGGHVHDGYNLDTTSGEYSEHTGGENSDDRSYNK